MLFIPIREIEFLPFNIMFTKNFKYCERRGKLDFRIDW